MVNLLLFMLMWLGCSDKEDVKKNSSSPVEMAQGIVDAQKATNSTHAENSRGVSINVADESGTILERHQKLGTTPQNAIALWIEAAIRAQNGEEQGWNALSELTLPLREENGWQSQGRNTYFMKAIDENNPVFRSFIVGSTPENKYAVDLKDVRIRVAYENTRDSRGRKFMLVSSGSSMPRPIYVQQSNQTNLFYINEYSSMYVDVRPPVDPNKETFK